MTITAERTALTRDEAKAVIVQWTEAGLPDGRIQFHPTDAGQVYLQVPDAGSLIVWSIALGIDTDGGDYSRFTHWCEPDALPGWRFSVYCECPLVPEAMRIRCGGEPR